MRPRTLVSTTALCMVLGLTSALQTAAAQSTAPPTDDLRLVEAAQRQDTAAVQSLLGERVDVDTPQADGATPLAWAAHWDDLGMADLLMRAGANVNAANDLGVTPLMLACTNGSAAMVEALLHAGTDPAVARSTGETALMMASRTGSVAVVRLLVAHGIDVNASTTGGHTALMWAAAERHADVVRVLAEIGADVHARTAVRTRAARPGGYARKEPKVLSQFEAVNPAALPRDGDGDPPRPEGGFTPLLYAVTAGDLDVVRVLLAAGANVDEAGPDGMTALMLALIKRHEAIALFLLDQGADPHAADAGYTALHLASATGHLGVAEALLTRGADPNLRLERPQRVTNAFEIGVFQSPGSGRLTQIGSTPFIVAAKSANARMMRLLAAAGADPRLTTNDGTTALMLAAGLGKRAATDITYYEWTEEKAVEALRMGLELGVDINAANAHGETALHAAAYHNANQVIEFLVEAGANIDATNAAEQTALRIAEGHLICCTTYVRHTEAAERLRGLGADPDVGIQLTFGLTAFGDQTNPAEPNDAR
ncbi:MAG: ankyrin repeat domain-containing protein [Vicinamibacterales bacterium]|nr:ankyrin repeat domain-containing protein [Vicinamibacterales bacterium]